MGVGDRRDSEHQLKMSRVLHSLQRMGSRCGHDSWRALEPGLNSLWSSDFILRSEGNQGPEVWVIHQYCPEGGEISKG